MTEFENDYDHVAFSADVEVFGGEVVVRYLLDEPAGVPGIELSVAERRPLMKVPTASGTLPLTTTQAREIAALLVEAADRVDEA